MKIDNSGNKKVPALFLGQEVWNAMRKVCRHTSEYIVLKFFSTDHHSHILGGCPMSDNNETGMVDNNLKVHGYPDFYITDGSVIQGNIGVNPS